MDLFSEYVNRFFYWRSHEYGKNAGFAMATKCEIDRYLKAGRLKWTACDNDRQIDRKHKD